MLNKISLALADESGNIITIDEKPYNVEMKLDTKIIELWRESCERLKDIADEELRFAQKFEFINLINDFFTKQEDLQNDNIF